MEGGIINRLNEKAFSGATGIYNDSNGIVNLSGGVVNWDNSEKTSEEKAVLNRGLFEMTGGKIINITSNSTASLGIRNHDTGKVKITGGTIRSEGQKMAYGIINENKSTIIIGNDEEKMISQESPSIEGIGIGNGLGWGIFNDVGNVEFYNGIIQGSNMAVAGNVTKVRENYKVEENIINELESIYLVEKMSENIVRIGEQKFDSLLKAIDSVQENEEKTIQIIKDFELEEPVKFNKNIVLDLNGYTIINKYYRIENTNNLRITDTTENKEGKIENIETMIGILNKEEGYIEIEEGTISCISDNIISNDYYSEQFFTSGIYNIDSGRIKMNGGSINSSNSYNKEGICISYGICNLDSGYIEINGGSINSSSNYNTASDDYSYLSSVYDSICGISNSGSSTLQVNGGTISSSNNNDRKEGSTTGIYNSSSGMVQINGGAISCSNNSSAINNTSAGISNSSSGMVQINGGIISSSNTNGKESYGIKLTSGTVEVKKGTVIGEGSRGASYCGIYNSNSGGIMIIGTKGDGIVSQEQPQIKGKDISIGTAREVYGIYNTKGKLYIYDGIIQGKTKAVYDTITEREDNTELNYNEDETVLTLSTTLTDVAKIGDNTYVNLQEAINSAGTEKTKIELLRNVVYTINDSAITIPNTKNIVLDLNGYKITSSILEKTIQNEGTLEIIDSSESLTGTIVTGEEVIINNLQGAQLIISGGYIENRTKQGICNEGELIVQGGKISSYSSGIYNVGEGTVNITGGTVMSSSYGIYNISTGKIKMTGGEIYSSSQYGTNVGIYNYSTGTIEVTGGTISTETRYYDSLGIYNGQEGTIIIGTKGEGGQEFPIINSEIWGTQIRGDSNGIYNLNGTLNIYDGIITGSTRAINGTINEIEDLTELLVGTDSNGYETIQLEQKNSNVAQVNGIEYDSIQEAIKACRTTASTIKLLRDSNPGATIIIEQGQNITLDLNGFTTNTYQELTNNGTLKITDTSATQAGKIVSLTGIVITNKGTMELQAGSISDSGYGIKNTGTLNITGGNIQNNSYGIYNEEEGTVNISGGNIISNTYGIYNYNTYNIIAGNITSNTYGIYNYGSSGTNNITGGIITSNDYGIYNANGTTNITSTGITANTYGIYIAGGTVNVKESSEIQSNVGVYVSKGTLNIGESGSMNSSSPVIIGEEYGISVLGAGTVYMYDGQVKGKTGATQGYISYTETGYQVGTRVEGEYMIDYLALAGTISTVAEVNGISFSNLQSAINSVVGEEAQTVKLTNGLQTDITFTIAEGQNVILDMNGKTITSALDITIENAGNLSIIDSSGNNVGKISSTAGTAIKNTGTLTLGQDDGTVNQDVITIEGAIYGIETSGTLNFYDGTINGASAVNGTITKRATGYVIRTTTVNGKERYYLTP